MLLVQDIEAIEPVLPPFTSGREDLNFTRPRLSSRRESGSKTALCEERGENAIRREIFPGQLARRAAVPVVVG